VRISIRKSRSGPTGADPQRSRSGRGGGDPGQGPAIGVSVNGAVTGAETPQQAVALAVFLEDAARVELAALNAGLADARRA